MRVSGSGNKMTVNELKLTNNRSSSSDWGLLHARQGASLEVNDSLFHESAGLAIGSNTNGSVTVNDSVFNDFGGGAISSSASGGGVTVNGSEFNRNSALEGGAIRFVGSATLEINDSEFTDNVARRGGALYLDTGASLIVRRSSFIRNRASTGHNPQGGAIIFYLNADSASITDSVFIENSDVWSGGAISIESATEFNIYDSVFARNSSSGQGGAIFSLRHLRVENSTFYENTAGSSGKALNLRRQYRQCNYPALYLRG